MYSKEGDASRRASRIDPKDLRRTVSHLRSDNAVLEFERLYTTKEVIGQGAFGIVNVVENNLNNKLYASKTLKKKPGQTSLYEQQEKEIDILKSIQHENILELIEVYENPQKIILITELCHGGELMKCIRSHKYISNNSVRDIIMQLIDAVTYLHRYRIVHRDIKPENILLKEKIEEHGYIIKLADFGLACNLDSISRIDKKAGTRLYMAPEIIKQAGYNHTCDIWSIGVMLYLLLCQYRKEAENMLYDMIQTGKIEYPDRYWSRVDQRAINLCKSILRIDPAMRISAGEILNHSWLTNKEDCNNNGNVIDLMRSYNAERRFKKAIGFVLAAVRWAKISNFKLYFPTPCQASPPETVTTSPDEEKVEMKREASDLAAAATNIQNMALSRKSSTDDMIKPIIKSLYFKTNRIGKSTLKVSPKLIPTAPTPRGTRASISQ